MRILSGLLLRAIVVLTGTALATFALLWHAPGDPALAVALARYRSVVPDAVIDQVRAEAGFDAGFWQAFFNWLGPLLRGDFGQSSVTGRDVWPDLVAALSSTIPLALSGLAIGVAISVPLAILATKRPGGWLDRFSVALASLGQAIPQYWLGLLLVLLFAVHLAWLPAMGARTPAHMILPALTLGLTTSASLTRIMRSGILEARNAPFLPALRRRGVPARAIGTDHVAPHAAIPVITVFGLELAFPKVQAVVIIAALLFVTINLLIDLAYSRIDPRIGERDA